jgi:hypothetical protein
MIKINLSPLLTRESIDETLALWRENPDALHPQHIDAILALLSMTGNKDVPKDLLVEGADLDLIRRALKGYLIGRDEFCEERMLCNRLVAIIDEHLRS